MLKNGKHADYGCYVQELRGAYGAGFRSGGEHVWITGWKAGGLLKS